MPPPGQSITLAEAADHAGLTVEELGDLIAEILAEYREQTGNANALLPFQRHGDAWPYGTYRVWALKMGLWSAVDGQRLIGFAGMAWITGCTAQYMRKLASTAANLIDMCAGHHESGLPDDLPKPVGVSPVPGGQPVFFDTEEVIVWARQTGRLRRPYRSLPR